MKKLCLLLGVVGMSLSAIFVRLASAPSMVLVFYRVALSALRFELAETVTWLPVFSGAVPEALAVELEKQGSP